MALRSELTSIFEKLIEQFPTGVAELSIMDFSKERDAAIELKPANPGAALCGVHFDDKRIYSFSFGARSYWEFPYERRYRKNEKTAAEEIEEMARAVLDGNCEEQRGWFSLTGRIWIGDFTYRTSNFPMFPIPPFYVRRYEPYVQMPTPRSSPAPR